MHGLTKHFGRVRALTDLSLDVPAGSIYGFLGPNGSGKTTTLRILAGLSRPTSGSAEVMGVPVTPAGKHRHHVGFLGQEPRFYRWMTGRQTLRYVARYFGPVDDKYIDHLLDQADIYDAANRKTKTYSGGMRQRLGIAQALVGRPKLLMLDEPVSALDPVGRAEVLNLMKKLKGDTTIFFSTHILEDVQRCSDFVAILHHGKLIKASNTADLLASFSKGRLAVSFAGGAPPTESELRAIPGVLDIRNTGTENDKSFAELVIEDGDGRTRDIQRSITKLAADKGLAVLECDSLRLNLEKVFLKLIREGDNDQDRDRSRRRGRDDERGDRRRDERDDDRGGRRDPRDDDRDRPRRSRDDRDRR
jgi:ABC-2 type transport system ATP-binding protein